MSRKKKKVLAASKKRGPKGWTTEAQERYLTTLIPAYAAAKSGRALGDFWPTLWDGWYKQWELAAVTEEEAAKGVTEASKLKEEKSVSSPPLYSSPMISR
jgi:hypothetical protein